MPPVGLTEDAGDLTAIEGLVARLRRLNENGPVAAEGRGSVRYGLALERGFGIPRNSSKASDFRGNRLFPALVMRAKASLPGRRGPRNQWTND